MSFDHKFPLVSRCSRIRKLVSDHRDNAISKVELLSLPGGVETFEQAAKFCYADNLKIISRCIDAIASKACVEQIASSFSRLEYSSSGRLHMSRQVKGETDWWIKDLSVLLVDMYQRVMTAMKYRGVRPESIGESLMSYAEKELLRAAIMLDCMEA
ncbi:BTB/POZ domain-containing protein, partial [Tanacetum coccineum]